MNRLIFSLLLVLGLLLHPQKAHAIIFLPAIILIPIAKIVAIVIGGFSIPSLGLGALIHKLFGKSLKKTLVFIFLFLVFLGILLGLFLKLHNPDRPWI
jgi:hypothetical protein